MIQKIKKIFKNKDARTLLENFMSLSVLQLVGMLLPLITLPYVLRTLGFSNYGVIVLAASLIAYFQSVTDYSFRVTATRDVAVFKNSPRKLDIIYSRVLTIKAIFLTLSVLLISLIVYLYPPFFKHRLVFFLTVPMLFGYTLFPEWFFQGIERMKYITFLNLGIKLFFTFCVFIFIKKEEDFWIYPLLQSLGLIGAGIIGQYILVRKYKLTFLWLGYRSIKHSISENFPIFVNRFLPTLYNNTSTFLLGVIAGTNILGTYDAIKKIIDLCISLLNVISQVFFPFLNRRKEAFYMYKKWVLIASLGLASLPILFNRLVFWYLSIEYEHAFLVLAILSIGIVGTAIYDIFGMNYFIVHRKDRLVLRNTLLASMVGLALAFPFIYIWGVIGAAINLTLARWIMGMGLFFKYKKHQ